MKRNFFILFIILLIVPKNFEIKNLKENIDEKKNQISFLEKNLSNKKAQLANIHSKLLEKNINLENILFEKGIVNQEIKDGDEFYFHTDYRRDLNYNYCKKVDYVMWGETDSFFPREAFQVVEVLSNYADSQNIHRYLMSFADRKMWDSSWDPLVHVDYRDVEFIDDDKGHLYKNQAKSQLSIKEMNEINARAEDFDFNRKKSN